MLAAASKLSPTHEAFSSQAAREGIYHHAHFDEAQEDLNRRLSYYEANAASLQAAALRVLDINGDGKLQENEVVDALTPDRPRFVALHQALGMKPDAQLKHNCAQQ